MKTALRILLIAEAIVVGCGGGPRQPTEITFYNNFEQAKATAVQEKKPMIVDFYAEWSQDSKTLDSVTFADSIVISMSSDMIFAKVDAEKDLALAQTYGIAGFPTVVVTGSDGAEIDRILGYVAPHEFYNQIQLYLQGKETLEDYIARLEDEPDNPEYLMTIGEKCAGRSQKEKAIDFFNRVYQLDQDNVRGLGARAMAAIHDTHARFNDFKSAIEVANQLMNRFPISPETENALALSGYYSAQSGDDKGALAIYRQYLEKYPDGKNAWVEKRIADLEEKL
jgi:tetratricopeptide (TPR) repeat protein